MRKGSVPQPVNPYYGFDERSLPVKYRPLGAWEYFGYALLFSIPIVGFICLIVFSCSDSNINRRNYARSYWCLLAIALIVTVVLVATGVIVAGTVSRSYRSW